MWLGYNQTVCLLIICLTVLLLLFFQADKIFGAAGLSLVYKNSGGTVAFILFVLMLYLPALWDDIAWGVSLGLVLLLGAFVLAIGSAIILIGWALAVIVAMLSILPNILLLVSIGGVFYFSLWALMNRKQFPASNVKLMTLGILFFAALIIIGISFSPQHFESTSYGSVSLEEHRYFLYLRWGWLGEPDWFELYECNAIGIGCLQIAPYDIGLSLTHLPHP